jgi:hypothetical protein
MFEARRSFIAIAFQIFLVYAIRRIQVNQKALKLKGTHQLLVYAEDVNILGRNVHTITKNTDASLLLVRRMD